jgi:hypothetical protein
MGRELPGTTTTLCMCWLPPYQPPALLNRWSAAAAALVQPSHYCCHALGCSLIQWQEEVQPHTQLQASNRLPDVNTRQHVALDQVNLVPGDTSAPPCLGQRRVGWEPTSTRCTSPGSSCWSCQQQASHTYDSASCSSTSVVLLVGQLAPLAAGVVTRTARMGSPVSLVTPGFGPPPVTRPKQAASTASPVTTTGDSQHGCCVIHLTMALSACQTDGRAAALVILQQGTPTICLWQYHTSTAGWLAWVHPAAHKVDHTAPE